MARLDGISVIAFVLVGSFAIDRIVTFLLFVLAFNRKWAARFPKPALVADPAARARAEDAQKVVYFVFAGALAIPLLAGYGQVRVLEALGFQTNFILDTIVTGLILMGGSDRVAELLKMPGAPGVHKPEPRPITIQGTLVLQDRNAVLSASGPGSAADARV
jgi:hypothetical protein